MKNSTHGTMAQFIQQLDSRIAELQDSTDESVTSAIRYDDVERSDDTVSEVLNYFQDNLGWDISNKRVRDYAQGVAEYIDISREAYRSMGEESPYTLDDWYNDTKSNYPEELEEFEDSSVDSCESIMAGENPSIDLYYVMRSAQDELEDEYGLEFSSIQIDGDSAEFMCGIDSIGDVSYYVDRELYPELFEYIETGDIATAVEALKADIVSNYVQEYGPIA